MGRLAILFLGAGYGTRLQRDVIKNPKYAHLTGVPKALVPLGRYGALLDYWLDRLTRTGNASIDMKHDCYIVTNEACHKAFIEWANRVKFPVENICNDGTTSNETRLGAVGDIQFALEAFELQDRDVLVIAGDTVFYNDFDLGPLLSVFEARQDGCLVTYYECSDAETTKTGILELDSDGAKVTAFVEKPEPSETLSRKACPCFYFFRGESNSLVQEFLAEKAEADMRERDASGKYIGWLIHRYPVYAVRIPGRLEVGDLPSYIEADAYFRQ